VSEGVEAQSHAQQARQYLKDGRYQEALAAAHLAVEAEPESAEARSLLGVALCRTGALAQGIEALRAALALNPQSRVTRRNLALALEQDMQLASAAVEYQALVDTDPTDARARESLEAVRKKLSKVTGGAPVAEPAAAAEWDPLVAEPSRGLPPPPAPVPGVPWTVGVPGVPPPPPAPGRFGPPPPGYGPPREEEAPKYQGDDPGGWSLDNVLGIVTSPLQFFQEHRGYTGVVKPMLFVAANAAILLGISLVIALVVMWRLAAVAAIYGGGSWIRAFPLPGVRRRCIRRAGGRPLLPGRGDPAPVRTGVRWQGGVWANLQSSGLRIRPGAGHERREQPAARDAR
jgi:hypothetical protein